MIAEEERRYQTLTAEKTELTEKCRRLEHFQTVISEMLVQLSASGEDKSILASLCQQEYSAAEKVSAVESFRQKTAQFYDCLLSTSRCE